MFEPEKPKIRVCAATWVFEKDLPDGEKLFDCSKCRGVCYRNREAQRMHWPIHKQVCCRPEQDIRAQQCLHRIQTGDVDFHDFVDFMDYCDKAERIIFQQDDISLMKGRTLVYCLQYIKWIFDTKYGSKLNTSNSTELARVKMVYAELIDYKLVRPIVQTTALMGGWPERYREMMWAVPDFANWVLSEDILLPPAVQEIRNSEDTFSHQALSEMKFPTTAEPWVQLVEMIFSVCSTSVMSRDETQSLLDTPLAVAIVKCQMLQWGSFYIRKSCPYDGLFGAFLETLNVGLISLYVDSTSVNNETLKKATASSEVLPGMTAFNLVHVLLNSPDIIFGNVHLPAIKALFNLLINACGADTSESGPFSHLTHHERIHLMNSVDRWNHTTSISGDLKEILIPLFITLGASSSSKVVLETLAVIETHKQKVAQDVLLFYECFRQRLIDQQMPSLQAYLECSKRHDKKNLPELPQECLELVAEFAGVAYYRQGKSAAGESEAIEKQVAKRLGL
jgi:hypothetical protein